MGLTIAWADNRLTVRGDGLPEPGLSIWYLEAYCRPGSTDRDWGETVIPHRTELLSARTNRIALRCTLADEVVVRHTITAGRDAVTFRLDAHNPTAKASEAHWGQPCIPVGAFTGGDQETYLGKCFVFAGGALRRMPTDGWATSARYTPGQVWGAPGVPDADLNPRPHHPKPADNGLIGCFSKDERWILATAWQPYQELFQGIIRCLHSDFRIGGLNPGERKRVRGKLYVVPNDVPALLRRYRRDFPEHRA